MTDEDRQTKFNAALSSLERLHKLLEQCNFYSRACRCNGYNVTELKLWRDSIKAFYREIYAKVKDKELTVKINNYYKDSKKVGSPLIKVNTPNGFVEQISIIRFNKHWDLLDKLEITLRVEADRRGLLIPDKDSARGSIADME